MNDKTITIYNYHKSGDKTEKWQRTVLNCVSVLYGEEKAMRQDGVIARSQLITIVIPFDVDTERNYINAREFEKLEDTSEYWTINPECNKDMIVCCECDNEITKEYPLKMLKVDYQKCGVVSSFTDATDMPRLKHYKVVCK